MSLNKKIPPLQWELKHDLGLNFRFMNLTYSFLLK